MHSVCDTTKGGNGEGGKAADPRSTKSQGKEGAGQGGERHELRGRVVVKMKAPPLVAAPLVRGRRNRPIDSRIYLEGGMIQPGRLPRLLLPATRDARDPREPPRGSPFRDRPPRCPRISSIRRSVYLRCWSSASCSRGWEV